MNRIDEIKVQINDLYTELHEIQKQCNHPPLARTYEYKSNTGNYDPHADCYWIDYRCNLCHASWSVDSDHPDYRPPEGAKKV